MAETIRRGGCNCGEVQMKIRGEPVRVGLCHCLTCRKETGAAVMAFADWHEGQVSIAGETASWMSTTDRRYFCPACGSTLFVTDEAGRSDEVEVRLGTLDEAPSGFKPEYELWTIRREHWLQPVAGAVQHRGNRS